MSQHFDLNELQLLNDAEEVEIETKIVQEQQDRRVIWIVVVGSHPYVRSVNAKQGHWYQELIASHGRNSCQRPAHSRPCRPRFRRRDPHAGKRSLRAQVPALST